MVPIKKFTEIRNGQNFFDSKTYEMTVTCNIELSTKYRPFSILGLELDRNTVKNMHKSSLSLEKYAGVILLRPEYAGVSSGVEKIAPNFCRSKKIYSGRSSVWSPLVRD